VCVSLSLKGRSLSTGYRPGVLLAFGLRVGNTSADAGRSAVGVGIVWLWAFSKQ
jgi:hypothetical protein